ncbi:glycosyltransferase family 4 protein [Alteromonas pelagimontana]|uniref:Glycosyltransferase family 4 protein n=1 Tax=Alteromonas pelagimontana TaxID=1858656 RepID=A0A6M4MEX0_9ALTE|nr:glycosyltransferase family 4 protein [Alteromonas pelagimontana]QJR81537.1 glycosyltransferase family 4 protein [Alteromonas pelagimontana]
MLLDVVTDKHFYRCAEGSIWTDEAFPYGFWCGYLSVFNQVNIVAPVYNVKCTRPGWLEVTGEKVSITAVPAGEGLEAFAMRLVKTCKILRQRKGIADKVIFRLPGFLSWLYQEMVKPALHQCGAEVTHDPVDVYAKDNSVGVWHPFLRKLHEGLLRQQCRQVCAISYATEHALQERYPPAAEAFHTHYSSIFLNNDEYHQRTQYPLHKPVRVLCISSLSHSYKGCDVMLAALRQLIDAGVTCHLTWIGGGQQVNRMQGAAVTLGLHTVADFVGNVSCEKKIRDAMDAADIFIMPSKKEKLPHALLGAMARSVICIASSVAGVNELLNEERIVERGSAQALSEAIQTCLRMSEKQRLDEAKQNFQRAQDFHYDLLQARRLAMFAQLRNAR